MDPNLPISISVGVGALLYTAYLVKSAMQDVREHEGYPTEPVLLPEQALSLQQPRPNIAVRFAEAWKEVKSEREMKALPLLEKVHSMAPEKEWFLENTEEIEDENPDQTSTLAPLESIPIDQLESHSKRDYYNSIADIADQVVLYYEKHGKVTRDGMVPSTIVRREWDHTMSQPNGIFWKAGMLENQNGVTVVLKDADEWLHLWFRERDYKFDSGIYVGNET
jgi:hypothetical protein